MHAMERIAAVLAALCIGAVLVNPYPSGAPEATCQDLTPRHGTIQPQVSEAPYLVTPSVSKVNAGGKVRLVLTSPTGESLKGFMVQAHSSSSRSSSSPVGTFTEVLDVAKAIACNDAPRNTLTHTNNELKSSVEIEWEAPDDFDGTVVFNTTFVKDGATFWVGEESSPVQVVRRSVPSQGIPPRGISTTKIPIRVTTVPNYTPPSNPQGIAGKATGLYTGCDDTKLCFGIPAGCVASASCSLVVSVTMSPSPPYDFKFELFSSDSPGYVAIALSNDAGMGSDDQVVACTQDEKLIVSMNIDKSGNRVVQGASNIVKDPRFVKSDGTFYCSFTRPSTTKVETTTYNLLNTQYYLLIAKGAIVADSGAIKYHGQNREKTANPLSLGRVEAVAAASNLLYRLHGTFMLVAWIGLAGTGMLLARYFKKTWVGRQACGKDIWFASHRGLMVMTWLLTCVGFVLIFVEVGEWYSETSNPHGVLGVITTALVFFQPFGALLRPAPSDANRPIFNWTHWGVGNLSHLLAIITIFFSRQLTKAELPEWNDYIVAAYVAFHVAMHLIFSLVDYCSQRPVEARGNQFPMKEMGGASRANTFADDGLDAPLTCLRRCLLALYLLVVLLLTVALVVVAAVAPIESNETVQSVVSYIIPNN